MAANDNINVSYQQAQDLQRELERVSAYPVSPLPKAHRSTALAWLLPEAPRLMWSQTLQKLERTGLLRQAGGDEVRTIVAEDIAEHFGERYRVFPAGVKHEGLNIRRDSVPKTCVLRARIAERVSVASQASYVLARPRMLHTLSSLDLSFQLTILLGILLQAISFLDVFVQYTSLPYSF